MFQESLSFMTRVGAEIGHVLDDLAALRIRVFRDFPYLYEGSPDYEKEYLKTYIQSERSFMFAICHGRQMVGATTGLPLVDEMPEIRQPFEQAGYDLSTIFYFGESLLLHEYRGQGIGHRFFDEREAFARTFQTYTLACFCSVDRPENHPARPVNYRPNDGFWLKRGYRKEPALQATLTWPDIGEDTSSPKLMTFWVKEL
ncbi:GNAT family N-acetyltransferase [Nibrella saemangeumensis]|uniref:GNAT family N-acetyltransferase n=1 Tax=Nibrella saemangeumensis TaxID=1084526 RepID=A0ABP8NBS3_9BACT